MPKKATQAILGHAQYAVTAAPYSHALPNMKAKEMEKLAHLFEIIYKEEETGGLDKFSS
ncbi:MAG: hypothetical protein LBS02_03935 [Hungatella sp.]|jgi:hypothetical protein|nr:hypothetical protein [Hungatella sp.]